MKRYEGLFILNNSAKEENLKETIDKLSDEINAAGGKVEAIQKMDKRNFVRVADKKFTSGFYLNVILEIKPAAIAVLRAKFALNDDVFRVMFTEASAVPAAPALAVAK